VIIVAAAFGVLAVIAWAAAWQTLHWLGDAEDLLELLAWHAPNLESIGLITLALELRGFRRRTPRRST
jgi:hypothetical protein